MTEEKYYTPYGGIDGDFYMHMSYIYILFQKNNIQSH